MLITENQELSKLMLDHLVDKYKLYENRYNTYLEQGKVHLSSTIYCLTRCQMDMLSGASPTDDECMLFTLGLGLQDVLTPRDATAPVLEKDGILYSPDFLIQLKDWRVELKTTRMSANKGDKHDFPETWIEYMRGGCFILGKNTYDLGVLYMMGYYKPPFPVPPKCYRFEFTDDELFDNWARIVDRRDVLTAGLKSKKIITPYKYCKDWECEHCRYKLVCEAQKGVANED